MTAMVRTATPREVAAIWTLLVIRCAQRGDYEASAWALRRANDWYRVAQKAPVNCRMRGAT
jgi:hypothetical protein